MSPASAHVKVVTPLVSDKLKCPFELDCQGAVKA